MYEKETNLSLFENFETENNDLLSKENLDEEIVETKKEKRSTLFTILNGKKQTLQLKKFSTAKNLIR